MNILIVNNTVIPATQYGGTERIIWWLGRELSNLGHKVTYLVAAGSLCPFAKVLVYNPTVDINSQVPDDIDIVHFQYAINGFTKKPYLVTIHNNPGDDVLDQNSVFVSANQAERHGSSVYVYNGIDPDDYRKPDFDDKRSHLHFLAKAAWRIKNVKGAIDIATKSNNKMVVLGGTRLNLKMGFRFTPNLNISFRGMVDNDQKSEVMNGSKGMVFPVLWHEPFGIAIIESLYFGCPVFATPYGSLPELVPAKVGVLSNSKSVLIEALKHTESFNKRLCHEYAADNFNVLNMAAGYVKLYQKVLDGHKLNPQSPQLQSTNLPKFLPWNN
jgi:glycosyltransferase involved in cell wall biosynthesis